MAADLAGLDLGTEPRVVLVAENSVAHLATAFAIWRAGATLVTVYPSSSAAEFEYALAHSRPALVVAGESVLPARRTGGAAARPAAAHARPHWASSMGLRDAEPRLRPAARPRRVGADLLHVRLDGASQGGDALASGLARRCPRLRRRMAPRRRRRQPRVDAARMGVRTGDHVDGDADRRRPRDPVRAQRPARPARRVRRPRRDVLRRRDDDVREDGRGDGARSGRAAAVTACACASPAASRATRPPSSVGTSSPAALCTTCMPHPSASPSSPTTRPSTRSLGRGVRDVWCRRRSCEIDLDDRRSLGPRAGADARLLGRPRR